MVKEGEVVKMIAETTLTAKIKNNVNKLLETIPFLKTNDVSKQPVISMNKQPDLLFTLDDGIRSMYIIVEIKTNGEPRYIRSAIQQLKEYVSQLNNSYGMVAAPYISYDTGNICKENGVGYIDTAGNCFINFSRVFIERKNYPNPNVSKRTLRSIFSNKATRVLRVLLCNPKRLWQVQELAKEANVSLGLAYKVKERLLDLEYTADKKRRISIIRPQELLNEWAKNYSFRKNKIYDFYSTDTVKQMEIRLDEYCKAKRIMYALTLFSGAARVAPYARYTRGFVYVQGNIKDITDTLKLKGVDSGANFTIMEPYDESLFYGTREMENLIVVSDVQLYLDLVSYKGRGEESAQFLLEQKLKPQW